MSANQSLMWIQAGACSGDTLSMLCAEKPSFPEFLQQNRIDLLWHPSLSPEPVSTFVKRIDAILQDQLALTFLCIEGSLVTGPHGSGMFDSFMGKAKIDLIRQLAEKADYLIAVGTCASFGGIHAAPPNPSDCLGLQFTKTEPGGLLTPEWRSRKGLPVINLSGCPLHPSTLTGALSMLVQELPMPLNQWHMPEMFFSTMVHQGCTRNEYHEYDIEEIEFGHEGCLFFNLGCQGPVTLSTCNTELWNGVNSKTRAGTPCLGCTMPNFPQDTALFRTKKVGDVPSVLPLGVERPNYMAYKGLARDAAPKRVVKREMDP
ncbi:hypothetical protein [Magnetococcus sp. PR-3]|uniref:NADH-quinone oxidoreductase subunit B family protein n=1 Tax=Magnetococcus sp. PR-3 TaxID=3120355 RepID=UPI002FCDF4A2